MYLKWILDLLCFVKFVATNKLPKALSKKEELYYLDLYKNQGDEKAKNTLIERNLRLVANIVKKYDNKKRDLDDLISIGTIGLIKGITTFKLEKESKLSTYISKCIENEILMNIRSTKKECREVSLFEQVGVDKEGNELSVIDTISSDEKEVFDEIYLRDNLKKIYGKIESELTETEKEVIVKRYGLYNMKPKTQNEVANDLKISRSYVSRIEKRALEKLKKCIDD